MALRVTMNKESPLRFQPHLSTHGAYRRHFSFGAHSGSTAPKEARLTDSVSVISRSSGNGPSTKGTEWQNRTRASDRRAQRALAERLRKICPGYAGEVGMKWQVKWRGALSACASLGLFPNRHPFSPALCQFVSQTTPK